MKTQYVEIGKSWLAPMAEELGFDGLYYRGSSRFLQEPGVGVVGSRKPDLPAMSAAWQFSRFQAERGKCVVSGLARGVDGLAHKACLSVGGHTIAVLAHGLDRLYPPEHRFLADQILKLGGTLVSPFEEGTPPLKYHFPQRNRIIAALSESLLIVQASSRSGSLSTARHALDFGREIFVLGGAFGSEGYSGSHKLIEEGATAVHHPAEWMSFPVPTALEGLRSCFENNGSLTSLGQIFQKSGRSVAWVLQMLELAIDCGQVIELSPQQYIWVGASDDCLGARPKLSNST